MAQLNGTFDATQVEPSTGQLPAGWYVACIAASSINDNKNGSGQHLSFEFNIVDGQFKGWKIWEQLNIWHSKASQIAQGKLSAISRAVNVLQFNDTNALHGLDMLIRIVVNADGRSEIKGFKPLEVTGHQASPGRAFAEQNQMGGQQQNAYSNPDGSPMNPQQVQAANQQR